MAFSEYLEKSVQSGNMSEIRGALIGYIDNDPAFKHYNDPGQLEDAIRYVSQKCGSPFEAHDGQKLDEVGNDSWNEKYFQLQKVRFRSNFSKERLEHLRNVGAKVNRNSWVYGNNAQIADGRKISFGGSSSYAGGNDLKKPEAPTVSPITVLAVGAIVVIVVTVGIIILVK